jgi:hypothetical protein
MNEFKLDNQPKIETGFKTPDSYFDTFYDRLELAIKNKKEPKVIAIPSIRKKLLYAVAAVVIIAISIPLLTNALQTKQTSTISTESIEEYLSIHQTISNHDVVELLTYEDIKTLEIDLKIDTKEIETILTQNDYLEDYLLD